MAFKFGGPLGGATPTALPDVFNHRLHPQAYAAQLQADQAGQQRDFQERQAAYDRDYQGRQADANRAASLAPLDFKKSVWNQISPLVTALGQGGAGDRVGGAGAPQPGVTVGGVWSPQQVDQQVNAAKSNNAMSAATQTRAAETGAAGRGFGANSPLLMALKGQIGAATMGANADADRQIRWDAAQGNAKQQLASEGLRGELWKAGEDSDIRRRQTANQGVSSLLAALGGFI